MIDPRVHDDIAAYYRDRIVRFGVSPAGVDWRDEASQAVRFEQLLHLVTDPDASVLDLGCGYGALLKYMRVKGFRGFYLGLDIAPEMIAAAETAQKHVENAAFALGSAPSVVTDFAVASGIFNVRLDRSDVDWQAYVELTIATLDRAGTRGFAFNCLTSYADREHMRSELFYADPCRFFDLCKRQYSRHVALFHDYGLYEFTVVVRK